MSKNKDSFLEMIGLDAEAVRDEEDIISNIDDDDSTGEVERPPYASQIQEREDSELDQPTDEYDEYADELDEATEFYEDEEVSKTVPETEDLRSSLISEPSSTDELVNEFDEPTEFLHEEPSFGNFVTQEGGDPNKTELTEKTEGFEDLENTDQRINSSSDAHALVGELEEAGTMEDALLEGLEEAEASRATDIFAQSYRADSRKTRARTHETEDDFLEEFEDDELDELIAEHKAEKTLPSDLIIEESSTGQSTTEKDERTVDQYLSQFDDREPAESHLDYEEEKIEDDIFNDEPSQEPEEFQEEPGYDDVLSHDPSNDPYMTQDSVKAQVGPIEKSDATIDLGRETMAFQYDSTSAEPKSVARIQGMEGPVASQTFSLENFPAGLGRDPGNEIVLDDQNVSRFHAEIHEHNGVLKIVDNNSTNGIKVNGALVDEKKLFDHDMIQIGDCIFEFLDSSSPARTSNQDNAAFETIVQTHAKSSKRVKSIFKKKNLKVAALVIVILGAGLLAFGGSLSSLFQSKVQQMANGVQNGVQVAVTNAMRDRVEAEVGLPLNQADPNEVKRAVIGVLSGISSLGIGRQDLEVLATINAHLYQAVLVDEDLYAAFQKNPLDFAEKREIIAEKFRVAQQQGDDAEALKWVELLLNISPNNQALQATRESLKSALNYVETPKKPQLSKKDEDAFIRVMNDHRRRVEEYINAGRLDSAIDLAKKVQERIVSLVTKRPEFSDFASGAIAEWKSKVRYLQKKQNEEKKQRREERLAYKESLKEMELIIQTYHKGDFNKALALAGQFERKYPDHKKIDRIEEIKSQISEDISHQYKLLEENVKRNIEIENFKLAWDSIYRFLDLLPKHEEALVLKKRLSDETKYKAQDLYNKARVYEVEASDLLSAEQAYRKALELSDPRSELSTKIERGYQKVRRKNLQ